MQPRATKLNLHEKINPRIIPQTRAKKDSQMTANPSVLAPLRVYTSLARTDVRTPGAFSLASNQPMFFLKRAP